MADVFVSYARDDRAQAQQVANLVAAWGWTVWWDRELLAGDDYERAIQDAIDQARCVIVLWSPASVASAWVRNEANEALRRRVLVPVVVANTMPPLAFRHLQTIPLPDSLDAGSPVHVDLQRAVKAVLRRDIEWPRTAPDTRLTEQALPAHAAGSAKVATPNRRRVTALLVAAVILVVAATVGGYLALSRPSGWKGMITSGATVGVRFDAERSLNTIRPRDMYFVSYRPEDGSWRASGRQTSGAFLVDEPTRPDRSCDPEHDALCIWGMPFTYDADGHVFVNGTRVGQLQHVTLRDMVRGGVPLSVTFDKLSTDINTIGRGKTYDVEFRPETGVWRAVGLTSGNIPQDHTDPEPEAECRPDDYKMCIWGAAFRFDDAGRVFEAEGRTPVGRVTVKQR